MSAPSSTTSEPNEPQHHVHFDETITLKDEFETENSVTYQKSGDRTIIVNLGFLQIHHRYHIDLRLPAKWLQAAGGGNATADQLRLVSDSKYETNVHCKLVTFHLDEQPPLATADTAAGGGGGAPQQFYNFRVEYFAHDEHLLKEELKMVNSLNEQDVLKFVITARVLGRGKGTPMLRNGIHCIGSEDRSDELGFDSDASADAACSSKDVRTAAL